MNKQKIKLNKKSRRKHRVRAKIIGTASRPRLSVFRSLNHIYVQLIDDNKGQTLISADDSELDTKTQEHKNTKTRKQEAIQGGRKVEVAYQVGELVAQKALKRGVKTIVFDRGGYKYHGRVRAIAEGARKGGLKF